MSTQGQTGTTTPMWMDGIEVDSLLEGIASDQRAGISSEENRFWSTPERPMSSRISEVLEVRFAGPRLVNYISFLTAHFPHHVTAMWRDENTKVWNTFQQLPDIPAGMSEHDVETFPVGLTLLDSLPTKVNKARPTQTYHPQHTGARHWYPEAWSRLVPVTVERVRLVLTRVNGAAPTDTLGNVVPYSLGVQKLQVGYRVNSRRDIPRRVVTDDQDSFASTTDLLGSRVLFGLREQRAKKAIDGNPDSSWRSEPFPFRHSVTSFYVDMRKGFDITDAGAAPPQTQTTVLRPDETAPDTPHILGDGIDSTFLDEGVASFVFADAGEITVADTMPSTLRFFLRANLTRPAGEFMVQLMATNDDGTEQIAEVTINPDTTVPNTYEVVCDIPADPDFYDDAKGPFTFALNWDTGDFTDSGLKITDWWMDGQVPLTVFAEDGSPSVVDRFWIDPLTPGVHCNLYYSNDTPSGDYEAVDEAIPYPLLQLHGAAPTVLTFGPDNLPDLVSLSATAPSFADIQNAYLQFNPGRYWWIGIDQKALTDITGDVVGDADTDHPWMSIGDNILRQNGGTIEFVSSEGDVATLDLPTNFIRGTEFRTLVVYCPEATDDFEQGLTLVYEAEGDENTYTSNRPMTIPSLRPETFSIGRYPNFSVPGNPALSLSGLVVKQRRLTADEADTFLDEGGDFVVKPESPLQDTTATLNAVLRIHPSFVRNSNPLGVRGGPGDKYQDMEWTPVFRDFSLKRGFMHIPPTRAAVFKFEFTNLLPEHYEVFVPIERTVQVFPERIVKQFREMSVGPWSLDHADAGVLASENISDANQFNDKRANLTGLAQSEAYSPTEALVVKGATSAIRAEDLGWNWRYKPWHVGTGAPRFIERQKHYYEKVKVRHRTKIGFYVGIKDLRAYRVNYLADDDTARYEEHFIDAANLESVDAFDWNGDGPMVSLGNSCEVVSKTFGTARPIRGLQYATKQADPIQLLEDDGFVSQNFTNYWSGEGDAEVVRKSARNVQVNRGWVAKTYAEYEGLTYADLEDTYYGTLEGGLPDGTSSGGLRSIALPPSGAGRMYAAAKVTATKAMTAPVIVEIVSTDGGTVLASDERILAEGETAVLWAGYTPGAVRNPLTYANAESLGTYGDIETANLLYGDIESVPIEGDVYARVIQRGQTDDVFTVQRLSLFDNPIVWSFSNDGGATWFDGLEIRNNPYGVMTFPTADIEFKWRLRVFRPDIDVSALYIRPWYGGLLGGRAAHHGMAQFGPNTSITDALPPVDRDPMWQQWDQPIPRWWYDDVVLSAFALDDEEVKITAPPVELTGTYPSDITYPAPTLFPAEDDLETPVLDESYPSGTTYPSDDTIPGA